MGAMIWEAIKKDPLVFLTICIVVVNVVLVYYTYQSSKRAEKLFIGQNKPLIDVTPISISQNPERTHNTVELTVSNYSGFVAYDIWIDVKYGGNNVYDNQWIGEWVRADIDGHNKKEGEKGVEVTKPYLSIPKDIIRPDLKELKSGETVTKVEVKGALNLNNHFDLKDTSELEVSNNYPVFVRVAWRNENGHVFDEIHQYALLCTRVKKEAKTKAKEKEGISFTFLPEGIISHKNMR